MPLRRVNLKSIRTALSTLSIPTKTKARPSAIEMWRFAITLITTAESRRVSTLGHIFLISHQTEGLSSFPQHPAIQLHVIRTGPLIETGTWHVPGWTLESDALRSDRNGLAQQLCQMLRQLRAGIDPGYLIDVHVNLKPGPGCSIEGILGDSSFPALGPGQKRKLVVKTRVGTHAESWIYDALAYRDFSGDSNLLQRVSRDRSEEQRQQGRPSSEELIAELDYLLSESKSVILTVDVKYRHSLLPANTTLSVVESCSLEQISAWRSSVSNGMNSHSDSEKEVQKDLMRFVATKSGPDQGLQILKDWFGADGSKAVCPEDASFIMEELEFSLNQARSRPERESVDDSQSEETETETATVLGDITNHRPRSPPYSIWDDENSRFRSTSVIRKLKPEESWVTCTGTDRDSQYPDSDSEADPRMTTSVTMSDMEVTATHRAVDELVTKVPVTDPARQIWGKIRKMSSPVKSGENRRMTTHDLDRETGEIAMLARMNKRSLGEVTLRSLRMRGVAVGVGMRGELGVGVDQGVGDESEVEDREREGVCSPWL